MFRCHFFPHISDLLMNQEEQHLILGMMTNISTIETGPTPRCAFFITSTNMSGVLALQHSIYLRLAASLA